MFRDNILVLGSKPNSNLPDINVSKIYTANGAAERAIYYRKKYFNNELICITGASEFARNEHVSNRIINAKPNRLIIRSGIITLPEELINFTNLQCLSNFDQWKFQFNFFKYGLLSLFVSEFCHQDSLLDKFIYVTKAIKNKKMQGVSAGFYAILLALKENPTSNIIISGIGMTGGKQFYKSERSNYFVYDSRARVDRFLVKKLKRSFFNRLNTLDKDLSHVSKIKDWSGQVL